MGYKVNIEPEANCYVSEEIKLVEVPVSVFDNRDDSEHQIVFFVTDTGEEYCVQDKIKKVCARLGYTVLIIESNSKLVKDVDAGMVFLSCKK